MATPRPPEGNDEMSRELVTPERYIATANFSCHCEARRPSPATAAAQERVREIRKKPQGMEEIARTVSLVAELAVYETFDLLERCVCEDRP